MAIELFEHQKITRDLILEKQRALVFNDPGTGKTASVLSAIAAIRKMGGGRALVLAPKAILEPAWCDDCRKFTPQISIAAAYAKNRADAFKIGTDIVVTNHDAAKWLAENRSVLAGFDILVIDESTAYKNRSAQRSKAVAAIKDQFEYRIAMTGTPMPNGLLDLWHQVYLIDDGERLSPKFFAFRAATHAPIQLYGNIMDWSEKEGAREAVADLLSDITVRYKFEDCVDVPANFITVREFDLPKKLRDAYDDMLANELLRFEGEDSPEVTAINAAALTQKLLQIASGAVYKPDGTYHVLDTSRYELIAELVAEREHSIVGFQWKHQRDELIKALEAAGVNTYAVIDSSARDVPKIVERFQKGEYQVILAQPQSASHGLTLTRATTTIWASPTWDAERFEQFNRRIYRTGQTQKTETILIQGRETIDTLVYERLQGKLDKQLDLLDLVQTLTHREAA